MAKTNGSAKTEGGAFDEIRAAMLKAAHSSIERELELNSRHSMSSANLQKLVNLFFEMNQEFGFSRTLQVFPTVLYEDSRIGDSGIQFIFRDILLVYENLIAQETDSETVGKLDFAKLMVEWAAKDTYKKLISENIIGRADIVEQAKEVWALGEYYRTWKTDSFIHSAVDELTKEIDQAVERARREAELRRDLSLEESEVGGQSIDEHVGNDLSTRQRMIIATYFLRFFKLQEAVTKSDWGRLLAAMNNGRNVQDFRTKLFSRDLIGRSTLPDALHVERLFRELDLEGPADLLSADITRVEGAPKL